MNNIAFPKLGISLNISPIAFSIGDKPIYWYAIIILTGFLLAILFVLRDCKKYNVKPEQIWDIATIGLVAGIIGARLYYVLFALDEFDSIWEVFQIWNGGLAIYGGIIAAFISTAIYCKVCKLNILRIFDLCCPGLFIGQAVGRWGNFVNCEVFGGETALPWGMSINGAAPVHPLFIYESLWNVLGLILVMLVRKHNKTNGLAVCFYVGYYSLGRFFLEGMRDTEYILYAIPNVIGISQIVALVGVAAAITTSAILIKSTKKSSAN